MSLIKLKEIVIFSTYSGKLYGSWGRGEHYVKIWEATSADETNRDLRLSELRNAPIYITDVQGGKIYRLNHITKDDLIHLFYKKYNSVRGSMADAENYLLEQRIPNGTSYLDLSTVALSNVQVSIKGLSKYNALSNAGFETGDFTSWTKSGVNTEAVIDDKYEGTYSAKSDNGWIYQEFMVNRGDVFLISIWTKSNTTLQNALRLDFYNVTGTPTTVGQKYINATSSWTKTEWCISFKSSSSSFTGRVFFKFNNVNGATSWVDAFLVRLLEVGYANRDLGDDSIAYGEVYNFDDYFLYPLNTTNSSITIEGETVSHFGALTNGSTSETTSLTGILTGLLQISSNIQGSEQAVLRITGTRVLYENSIILEGRTNSVYYGRYYGTLSLTTTTNDLIALTNVEADIESLLCEPNNLTLTIDALSGTTSISKVYCGDKGKPKDVFGVRSWSYDNETRVITFVVTHSSEAQVIITWEGTAYVDLNALMFEEFRKWDAILTRYISLNASLVEYYDYSRAPDYSKLTLANPLTYFDALISFYEATNDEYYLVKLKTMIDAHIEGSRPNGFYTYDSYRGEIFYV